MNRQIRKTGIFISALFVALILNLSWLQVIDAEDLWHNQANETRRIEKEYSDHRGAILSSDGVVLAESIPASGTYDFLRSYPLQHLTAHIVGFYSLGPGDVGLEATYNDELRGSDQQLDMASIMDRLRDEVKGNDITLTLDTRVQKAAETALAGRKGSVVALDPLTGNILAAYSNPSFDPNTLSIHDPEQIAKNWETFRTDAENPMLARMFNERYPPGSTFKIVTAAAALDAGITTPTEMFPVLTSINLPQTHQTLSNYRGTSCGGSLVTSFARSCNTVFASLALRMGPEVFLNGVEKFGFNDRPPLSLVTAKSVVPRKDYERVLPELAKSGIGQQDVQATPLQMALVAAAVANNGQIPQPQILKSIRDPDGRLLKETRPEIWRTAMSPSTADTLRMMMHEVVTRGTGRRAQISGVEVAGKTGTAETGTAPSHAWFVGFAPLENPAIAIAVIVENGGSGGTIAAPVAQQVMASALGK